MGTRGLAYAIDRPFDEELRLEGAQSGLALLLLAFASLDRAAERGLLAFDLAQKLVELLAFEVDDVVPLRHAGQIFLQPRHVALEPQVGVAEAGVHLQR